MAKAQAEFTTGVMKNETVRQAAGMNFYLFYMYFLNGGLKSKRLHLINLLIFMNFLHVCLQIS